MIEMKIQISIFYCPTRNLDGNLLQCLVCSTVWFFQSPSGRFASRGLMRLGLGHPNGIQWAIKAFAADCSADWMNESVWIMLDCNLALNLSFACPRPVGSSWGTRSKGAQNSSRDIRRKEIRSLARAWNIWNDTRSKSPICLPLGHWSLNRWDQCSPISGFLFTTSGPANLNSASRSRGPTRSTAETCQNIKNNLKFWSLTVQSCLLATGQNPTTCRVNCSAGQTAHKSNLSFWVRSSRWSRPWLACFFSKPSALTSSQHQVNQTTTRSKQRTVQLAMQPQQALHLGKALRSTNSARENLLRSQTCFLKAYIYIYISYIIYIYIIVPSSTHREAPQASFVRHKLVFQSGS